MASLVREVEGVRESRYESSISTFGALIHASAHGWLWMELELELELIVASATNCLIYCMLNRSLPIANGPKQ